MRPLLQHASRFLPTDAFLVTAYSPNPRLVTKHLISIQSSSLQRLRVQARASSISSAPRPTCNEVARQAIGVILCRKFSSSRAALEIQPPDTSKVQPPPKPSPEADEPKSAEPESVQKTEDSIARVPAEDLPSHKEGQRWDLSRRFSALMDDLLPKLAVVTHKVNAYTGTDYSGIEALRREIKEQEQLVKVRRRTVDEAKEAFDGAHAQQAASQKEVVGLLERKHSWSAADLERYMSLIRSEHVHDQAVRKAKEDILAAESTLEEARTQLEKRERAQYHEEQVWSDTIRRNSTWVTFGLMGFNIFLLLASLIIIEPWRRRRLVKEIKSSLNAQRVALETAVPPPRISELEAAIDAEVEPTSVFLEENKPKVQTAPPEADIKETIEVQEHVPEIVSEIATEAPTTTTTPTTPPQEQKPGLATEVEGVSLPPVIAAWRDRAVWIAKDIFSERIMSLRRLDFTIAVVQSAAAGAIITGALLALLRPR
ncbi:hypothetical protein EJ04DRAFT_465747 [Polyplosphaeria fusca]|uniref:Sensitive to high expression protein 9, mitochondrial n=1 Tax=Polyplosphaeria fusca TaxID=682080 RepID=A0A9P4R1B8_9PLEO|nr:hypothetical protein EJ04DRAFT_465747 [Polyplosphaeria fusca]